MTRFAPFHRPFRTMVRTAAMMAFTALTAAPLSAEQFQSFKVGNWTVEAHADDTSGRFTHCASSVNYKSGIKLLFSIDRNWAWNMGFAHPDWQLQPGENYSVQYQIDRSEISNATAVAASTKLARVRLPADAGLFRMMRRGNTLRVATQSDVMSFSLTSTNRMLNALTDCVKKYEHYVRPGRSDPFSSNTQDSNPFGAPRAATATPSPQAVRAEAYEVGRMIMTELDVTYNYVAPSDNPTIYDTYDSVWEMNKFIGSLRIVKAEDITRIDQVLADGEAERCNGDFHTKIKPGDEQPGAQAIRRVAVCDQTDGKRVISTFMTYPRTAGGSYILQIYTSVASFEDALKVGDVVGNVALSQVAGT